MIHAIHVGDRDLGMLADSGAIVSCPTTEGSLGDGHFPALRHHDAGVRIAIGSDSNVRVDPFEEARELETLARRRRAPCALLARPATSGASWPRPGRASLGLDDAGKIRCRCCSTTLRRRRADLPLAVATC